MASWVSGPVRVSVPATSANLGPGFDALGIALSLRDEIVASVTDGGLSVSVSGQGADEVPRDDSHLVVQAMYAGFVEMGVPVPGLSVACTNLIPHGRGLGSSAAAIVGGIAAARALVVDGAERLSSDAVFRLAVRLEGHPDNVAPAVYGGFMIACHDGDLLYAAPAEVDPRIRPVVLVPPTALTTSVARSLLPDSVPFLDAAANSGRAALLVAALGGRPELLLEATRDFLHQDYRESAMPESLALVRALRADGVPAVVSGAGPSVLVLSGPDIPPESLLTRCPSGWTMHILDVDPDGVLVS